ncbi:MULTISPECIES: hypothetical protein [unclassified Kitasatospora]|uniref:histidine kinase dimerization/phosphoacceptor domain-containing protein n=1 Tax=unclassified Kitasatospora TaxID=2633591 RepID=UPI0033F119ED
MTLHAGAAQIAHADDPDAVRQTLGLIRTLGLQALTELRGLLGASPQPPTRFPRCAACPPWSTNPGRPASQSTSSSPGHPPGSPHRAPPSSTPLTASSRKHSPTPTSTPRPLR